MMVLNKRSLASLATTTMIFKPIGVEGVKIVTQVYPNFSSKLKNMPSLLRSVVYEKLKYRTSIFIIGRETHGHSYIFVLIKVQNLEKNGCF